MITVCKYRITWIPSFVYSFKQIQCSFFCTKERHNPDNLSYTWKRGKTKTVTGKKEEHKNESKYITAFPDRKKGVLERYGSHAGTDFGNPFSL